MGGLTIQLIIGSPTYRPGWYVMTITNWCSKVDHNTFDYWLTNAQTRVKANTWWPLPSDAQRLIHNTFDYWLTHTNQGRSPYVMTITNWCSKVDSQYIFDYWLTNLLTRVEAQCVMTIVSQPLSIIWYFAIGENVKAREQTNNVLAIPRFYGLFK